MATRAGCSFTRTSPALKHFLPSILQKTKKPVLTKCLHQSWQNYFSNHSIYHIGNPFVKIKLLFTCSPSRCHLPWVVRPPWSRTAPEVGRDWKSSVPQLRSWTSHKLLTWREMFCCLNTLFTVVPGFKALAWSVEGLKCSKYRECPKSRNYFILATCT